MEKPALRFQKWDIAVIAGVVLLVVLVFVLFLPGQAEPAAYAQIYLDGELVKTVSLEEDCEFTVIGEYTNTISVRDQKIAVTHSDCPGGDCVASGWQNRSGRSIVCLPNGLEIRVVSENSDVDFVVG